MRVKAGITRSGFDGVAYRSSLGGGHNIALFDLACAELVNAAHEAVHEHLTYERLTERLLSALLPLVD